MGFALFLWLLCFVAIICLLFLQVYVVMSMSDLEDDLLNSIDFCKKLNEFVLPEIAVHFALTAVLLLTGHWLGFLIMLPIAVLDGRRLQMRQTRYDPTSIFVVLSRERRVSIIKVVSYMVAFFYCLFKLIAALVRTFIGHGRTFSLN
jgi:Zn-dependent protease